MRRYRNARYAPESLERKLSPSGFGFGFAPVPAHFATVSLAHPRVGITVHHTPVSARPMNNHDTLRLKDVVIPGKPGDTPPTEPPPSDPTGPSLPA